MVPYMYYWDTYHLSFGVEIKNESHALVIGFQYSLGIDNGHAQLVNLTEPTVSNYLFGERTNTADARFHQLSFLFGYQFNFTDKEK